MQKSIYVLMITLLIVSGIVYANQKSDKALKKQAVGSVAAKHAGSKLTEKEKWEATPDGIQYKTWEASADGKRVKDSYKKIMQQVEKFTEMQAVVTSVTFKRSNSTAPQPKWIILNIEGEQYMMQFLPKEFELLKGLQVNDKIILKSHSASHSPNHPYLIISADEIKQNNKIIFKRDLSTNGGC